MNRADLDLLFDDAVQTACHFLEKHGEFFPFGVVLTAAGERHHVEGWTGSEQPPTETLVEMLIRGFRSGADTGEYRATALVKDVRVHDNERDVTSDAVAVTLEHRDGTAIQCFLPYERTESGVDYGEVFANPLERTVFRESADPTEPL